MHSFKQFLLEAAVDKRPSFKKLSTDSAVRLLNAHCKNALWMLIENRPIYRGDEMGPRWDNEMEFAAVDTTATVRKSQNTSNWYTTIFDNHPDRKHFPKRSRSFIATTDSSYAKDFGDVNILIPTDSAKIGLVNDSDMWCTRLVGIPGWKGRIEEMNYVFNALARVLFTNPKGTIEELVKIDEELKRGNSDLRSAIFTSMSSYSMANVTDEDIEALSKNFLSIIWDAYSERNTKHTACTTATMPHKYDGELWIGGEICVISPRMWYKLRNEIRAPK